MIKFRTIRQLIVYAIIVTVLGVTLAIYREINLFKRINNDNGEVIVGKTLRYIKVGRNSAIEYVYVYNGVKYIGLTYLSLFSKEIPEVPAKYIIIVSKADPSHNLIVYSLKADTLKLNRKYADIKIDNALVRRSLFRGGNKARIVP